jgi:hypothetical protein
VPLDEFQSIENHDSDRYELFENTKMPDVIVMDPPLSCQDKMSKEELLEIFELIVGLAEIENVFIFVWTEHITMETITKAAAKAQLDYCDCIAVELVTEKTGEVEDEIDASRMVLLYKSCQTLKREMFAQQRAVDVGLGIVRKCGKKKSRGRLGIAASSTRSCRKIMATNWR